MRKVPRSWGRGQEESFRLLVVPSVRKILSVTTGLSAPKEMGTVQSNQGPQRGLDRVLLLSMWRWTISTPLRHFPQVVTFFFFYSFYGQFLFEEIQKPMGAGQDGHQVPSQHLELPDVLVSHAFQTLVGEDRRAGTPSTQGQVLALPPQRRCNRGMWVHTCAPAQASH